MEPRVRKLVTTVERIRHDGGPAADRPLVKGGVCAVIENPFAGRFVEDIAPFMEDLKPLGREMAEMLIDALGAGAQGVQAYGKGALVGEAGEWEHAALWHVPGGYAMRGLLGDAKAIVPSAKKVGGIGARLDVPLHHIDAAYVRSHFNAIELGVQDAPKSGEIVLMLAMATGARPHARVGGLKAEDIEGNDGQR
ncbi:MAG: amino acid synthesis family protein [Azospirillaceae bacterium]